MRVVRETLRDGSLHGQVRGEVAARLERTHGARELSGDRVAR
jgi:hypothetical protein